MPEPKPVDYAALPTPPNSVLKEQGIEEAFIQKLVTLKYHYRTDIRDRAALEANFREKFEALNRVRLTDADSPARERPPTTRSHPAESERSDRKFARLLDEMKGSICDPTCGSGGSLAAFRRLRRVRFAVQDLTIAPGGVQSLGQEKRMLGTRSGRAKRARRVRLRWQQPKQSNATTRRLPLMNLAIRGIEADLADCIVALPGQLFYSTQIPVCLWFLVKNKNDGKTAWPPQMHPLQRPFRNPSHGGLATTNNLTNAQARTHLDFKFPLM